MPGLLRPRALAPGDLVVIAALSGPLSAEHRSNVEETVTVFERMGFRVRLSPLVEQGRRRWWSAGRPGEVAHELNTLLRDPSVRAVVALDGGQTVLGYLDLIDYDAVVADPKPILGYSDISLLHLALYARTGLAGFHGDMAVPGFGGYWPSLPGRDALSAVYSTLLTSPVPFGPLPPGSAWECWRPGRAEGPLIGGVINRIALVQATPYGLPPDRFDGALLFWEELGGQASYVWSYLHVLRHSGILDRIAGMVVGVPQDISGLDETPLRTIVLDVLGDRDIGVLGNVDIGHAGANLPMPVGVRAALDAGERSLSLLEAAVR
ncbi:peptidase U61 [Paractinoplanes abujensis]|uniref:Muramoyltetrapeptide carboxypeptidase n=1 Tax=Paractinoplanes abujensis TaxID=882441 RepID=A0A7W7G0S7_9ACTN|nr:S66 peptidase family protein [Actinoplanes abujensis]MBB4691957.1 muramoyltetrapeptide carboxypeptidase [Actinoplanes abujensis]GID16625.1 peptidase U61 [Actinoplanes abujensis]